MSETAAIPGLKWRMIASFSGNIGPAVLSVALVPVYIHFLGIEAYGLIGFFLSLVPLLTLIDLGMSAALNREIARLSADAGDAGATRNLARTLETFYWCAPALVAALMAVLAEPIASRWLQLRNVTEQEAVNALRLMGLAFAARLPSVLYFGALIGLERIVLLNVLRLVLELVKAIGSVLTLWLIAPTLQVFFIWQIVAGLLMSVVLAVSTWQCMPAGPRARFDFGQLRRIARFAAGVSGVAVTAALVSQADKLVLSRLLTLEGLGYYTVAWTVASGLRQLTVPLTSVFLPRMSHAVAANDEGQLGRLYEQLGRLVSIIVVPAGLVIAMFSHPVLEIWTGNPSVASGANVILSLLVIGAIFAALAGVPYIAQLAVGWTAPSLLTNIGATIVVVPLTYTLASRCGAIGAAFGWAALNLVMLVVLVHALHRRVLRGSLAQRYTRNVMLPLFTASGIVIMLRVSSELVPINGTLFELACMLMTYAVAVGAAMLSAGIRVAR